MEYTKGEWKARKSPTGDWIICSPDELICREARHWNAQLIASAPHMCGQLKTGVKALNEARKIIVEVAKTCPPEIADHMYVLQAYVSGVIVGNGVALAKAEGK